MYKFHAVVTDKGWPKNLHIFSYALASKNIGPIFELVSLLE